MASMTPSQHARLREVLFRSEQRMFEVVEPDLRSNYLNWRLAALNGLTLAKENTLSGLTDGYFILRGILVHRSGVTETAYIDMTLPERITDSHFLQVGGELIRGTGALVGDALVIPAVAIEKSGVYDQYYVRGHAEIGLGILKDGLAGARTKWPIALDMAYILRDEKRYSEAIEAFTLAIETGARSYFPLLERAKLLQRVGNSSAAELDWNKVGQMAGLDLVRQERGY